MCKDSASSQVLFSNEDKTKVRISAVFIYSSVTQPGTTATITARYSLSCFRFLFLVTRQSLLPLHSSLPSQIHLSVYFRLIIV